ncbi:hypothetical protein TWF173_010747, partial [Orbilia oligospora]
SIRLSKCGWPLVRNREIERAYFPACQRLCLGGKATPKALNGQCSKLISYPRPGYSGHWNGVPRNLIGNGQPLSTNLNQEEASTTQKIQHLAWGPIERTNTNGK